MKRSDPCALRRLYLPEELTFRPATALDHPFLYELLVERYGKSAVNIPGMARAELPSYEEHVAHLSREPYARIEIVEIDGAAAGMMYLTHANVGGCFILRDYASRGVGLAACYRFFQGCAYPVVVHLSAHNRAGWRTAERLGFVRTEELPHRLTFELRAPPIEPFAGLRLAKDQGRVAVSDRR